MGGGAGGVALSLSMHHRMTEELQRPSARKVKVKCVPTSHTCLRPGWSPAGLKHSMIQRLPAVMGWRQISWRTNAALGKAAPLHGSGLALMLRICQPVSLAERCSRCWLQAVLQIPHPCPAHPGCPGQVPAHHAGDCSLHAPAAARLLYTFLPCPH